MRALFAPLPFAPSRLFAPAPIPIPSTRIVASPGRFRLSIPQGKNLF